MSKYSIIFIPLLWAGTILSNSRSIPKDTLLKKDTLSLKDYFQNAKWSFHSRTFAMSTINEGALKDDYAVATAVGLGVATKPFKGFQLGAKGYVIYNVFSSKLNQPDSITNAPNRYELGLFDVANPSAKYNITGLEELYLKYQISKSSITIGKQTLNTPFFNPQDGRIRPTTEQGIWLSVQESKLISLSGGWIFSASPRSTASWYNLSQSVGLYPTGITTFGKKANYYQNITGSSGMAIANISINPNKKIKINLWDGLWENVMNTGLIEINAKQAAKKLSLYEGLIYLHQDAINNGGNIDQTKTYMNKGEQSNVISAQLGMKNNRINANVNYTHVTGDGRYLMPREWGREIFYTFLPRERNEGFGKVNAFMAKISANFWNNKFKTGIAYGYYRLPDVTNYRLNKYGMPSYHQLNYEATYNFSHFFKGLEIKLLIAGKLQEKQESYNLKYVYNKVSMVNFNFILDFKI